MPGTDKVQIHIAYYKSQYHNNKSVKKIYVISDGISGKPLLGKEEENREMMERIKWKGNSNKKKKKEKLGV